jgi:hypothetical protein
MVLFNLIWPEKDRVSYDIPLDCEGKDIKLCFAILRKRLVKSNLETYEDLKLLCKKYKVENLNTKLNVFCDQTEFFNHFFDKQTLAFLNKYQKYIEEIHISDQQTFLRT